MSKEYKAYRFFMMIYVLIIANFAILISTGKSYCLWFFSSISGLSILLFIERKKVYSFVRHLGNYKLSRDGIFLLVFLITYPYHYQWSRGVDYSYIFILQLINVLLFFLTYCLVDKNAKIP